MLSIQRRTLWEICVKWYCTNIEAKQKQGDKIIINKGTTFNTDWSSCKAGYLCEFSAAIPPDKIWTRDSKLGQYTIEPCGSTQVKEQKKWKDLVKPVTGAKDSGGKTINVPAIDEYTEDKVTVKVLKSRQQYENRYTSPVYHMYGSYYSSSNGIFYSLCIIFLIIIACGLYCIGCLCVSVISAFIGYNVAKYTNIQPQKASYSEV
eukprot:455610_1